MAKIREIKWARTDSTLTKAFDPMSSGGNLEAGLLVRAVTGDSDPSAMKYNFPYVPKNTGNPQRVYSIWKAYEGSGSSPYTPTSSDYSGTTENVASTSGNGLQQVIPYVVSLKFTCYNKGKLDMRDKDGNGIPEDGGAGTGYDYTYNGTETAVATPLPYAVQVELTLLDKTSWEKWLLLLGGNVDDPASDLPAAKTFRLNNQRTFSKMVLVGARESL
jgi:hypothetical protein